MKMRLERFWILMFSLGLIYVIGVGGGLSQDTLTIGQALGHATIGFAVMIVAAHKGGFWHEERSSETISGGDEQSEGR